MRRLALGLLVCTLAACPRGSSTPESLRNLPPRHDPPLDLSDDDDLARGRALFDALPFEDPSRPARRRELVAAYRQRIDRVAGDAREEAFHHFEALLELWDARELDDAKAAPDLELVVPIAEPLYRRASTSGADLEATTALTVLRAAQPGRAAELDKTFAEIVAYTNELAVAESGPGAEGTRIILVLEDVTGHFPSRWAIARLTELYLARQDRINKAILAGDKEGIQGAHRDPGVARPTWNLIRAFARARHLEAAPDVLDKLAGQFGDEPELRRRLRGALEGSDGQMWLALMAPYLPTDRREDGDAPTAILICQAGGARLPKAVEPRKCVSEIARVSDRVPLALRWVEEGLKLAPGDRDMAEIAARLYLMRTADLMQAERLDAARAQVKLVEAFHADARRRWPGKPLESSLPDYYLAYARGLYNQGEIAESHIYIEKARKLDATPAVVEDEATIWLKTDHFVEAARAFERAADMKRPTPLATSYEGARLRRFAGEAWRESGDRKKAETLFKRSIKEWTEVLAAPSLDHRLRGAIYLELGRLYYDLGEVERALQAFNAVLDSESEQGGVYGDVISFLITRGHYGEALDAYHRALGRSEVTELLKVYTTLWMVDEAHVQKIPVDALAAEYLRTAAKGNRWYHQLARFKSGKLTFDELVARADTRGKRAEAYFYEGMSRYAKGDRAGAERLLAEVVATQMLGFFEYDMSKYYLKHGPPVGKKQ